MRDDNVLHDSEMLSETNGIEFFAACRIIKNYSLVFMLDRRLAIIASPSKEIALSSVFVNKLFETCLINRHIWIEIELPREESKGSP